MNVSPAYYNEIDDHAADWLENLIAAGLIAPGVVDRRDIRDVVPDELSGFTQCHFFAGIGIWSGALRAAGWPDDRPVWTASCPCQPFSAAGTGDGEDDERHLWPHTYHLIVHGKRPDVPVFGEQVASKDGTTWFDLVSTDMENADHACGALDLCSASFGAPNIRQRLYWWAKRMGDAADQRPLPSTQAGIHRKEEGPRPRDAKPERPSPICGLADTEGGGWTGRGGAGRQDGAKIKHSGEPCGLANTDGNGRQALSQCTIETGKRDAQSCGGLDHTGGDGRGARRDDNGGHDGKQPDATSAPFWLANADDAGPQGCGGPVQQHHPQGREIAHGHGGEVGDAGHPNADHGFWHDPDWVLCDDPDGPRWRPVEPGTFPLAPRYSGRVGDLRAYGNAVNFQVAKEFVEACMAEGL